MSNIIKYEKYDVQKRQFIDNKIQEYFHHLDVKIGDYIITENYILKINDIVIFDKEVWTDKEGKQLNNPLIEKDIILKTEYLREDGSFYSYGSWYGADEIKISMRRCAIIPQEEGYEKYLKECLTYEYIPEKQEESSALVILDKNYLIGEERRIVRLNNNLIAMRLSVKHVLDKKKQELERISSNLYSQIHKIQKTIYTIELYLGIKEDIIQIQSGKSADEKIPLTFRQRILYMDVECVDPTIKEGITFEKIDDFNTWLLEHNDYYGKKNYEVSIPEEKCVVVFKVRQKRRELDPETPWYDRSELDKLDRKTYIFLRNGDNIYYIWSDINIHPRLFPRENEFDLKDMSMWEQDRVGESNSHYKMQALMLQGLIDRTDIFKPLRSGINLLKPESYNDDEIVFIYDDDVKLIDYKVQTFKELWEELNSNIEEGSRVLVFRANQNIGMRKERLLRYYENNYSIPYAPNDGIYQVYLIKEKHEFKIMYNPNDDIWDQWRDEYSKRKNRLSYIIKPTDEFVMNWDAIKEEHLTIFEDMIYNRKNRYDNQYLWTIPFLYRIITEKKKEIEDEKDFRILLENHSGKTTEQVKEAIEWWKLKNKWKRFLNSDNAKAYRMIIKKLKEN